MHLHPDHSQPAPYRMYQYRKHHQSHHYPYLPVRWMLKDRFNSFEKVKNIHMPVLVVHGEKDRVVPVKFGKKLFAVMNEPKQAHYFERAGHEDLPIGELTGTVKEFVERYVSCNS